MLYSSISQLSTLNLLVSHSESKSCSKRNKLPSLFQDLLTRPFNFKEGKPKGSQPILHLNPYSWSKVSNIIYLDSPAGVGFSYSKNTTTYATGDLQVAYDTHNFLLKWFQQYQELLQNPFYISGESYAGVYVPTLAAEVVKGIESGAQPNINFKGYLVGNAYIADSKFGDIAALVPFAYGMGLISDDIYEDIVATCKGNYTDPSNHCIRNLDRVNQPLSGLNIYDILEPCYYSQEINGAAKGNISIQLSFKQLRGADWPLAKLMSSGQVPCFNDEVATLWLNDEAVRKSIHAAPESEAGPWSLCNDLFYAFGAGSMIEYYRNLTIQGYRALIYSGDHDMRVPYTGSQAWTRSLGYKIVDEWRSWLSNDQVAGYTQGYDYNLTFLTIKGAGHMVPQTKPQEALDFYSRWLEGQPI